MKNEQKHIRFDEDTRTYYYKEKKVPSVTTILRELGVTPDFPDGIQKIEDAKNVGTVVHKVLELVSKGHELNKALSLYNEYAEGHSMTVDVNKAIDKITAGMAWFNDSKAIPFESEFVQANEKYGGTADLIASINDNVWVVDWKTGSNVDSTSLIQVAAYCDLTGVENGSVAHLLGKENYVVYDVEEDHRKAWRDLLKIYYSDASDKEKREQAKSAKRFDVKVEKNIWVEFLDAKSKFEKCEQELDQARANLVESIGEGNNGSSTIDNFELMVTWVDPSESVSIDKKKFEKFAKTLPEEYTEQTKDLYKKTTRSGSHRITVKGKDNV